MNHSLLRRAARRPAALGAGAFLLLLIAVAAAAPLVAPYDPLEQNYDALLRGPSAEHLLGTDELGATPSAGCCSGRGSRCWWRSARSASPW